MGEQGVLAQAVAVRRVGPPLADGGQRHFHAPPLLRLVVAEDGLFQAGR